ncbi:MAG: polysaccharide pyruvyl transferase family protein [Thermoanaerobaculaceae bacterium]|nr:polysaccharide pyruvyl transferase family protein [Thermoanaerobaculaceae bacterium]
MGDGASPTPDAAGDLLDRLRATLDSVIGAALAGHPEVALATFPSHWNLGDTAVWAGQRATLARLGVRVPYVCDFRTYRPAALRRALPEGPILLSGGGNFGDVYPNEQGLRERILDDFPDRLVVQLPQSVWFRSEANVDAMRRRCERNGRFVMLVRDRRSLDLARARFAVPAHLAPDMAFGLPDLRPRRRAAATDVLWLLRRDIETSRRATRVAAARRAPGAVRDWTRPALGRRDAPWGLYARAIWLSLRIRRTPRTLLRGREAWVRRSFETLASLRMEIACRFVSAGRVLVTDRLHGHILALLLGVPNVCLDNRDGKVSHFYETWTAGHPLVGWADSLPEAEALARRLLAPPPSGDGRPGRTTLTA